ncbi:hypothetical protein WHI96_07895 [Pseudonocardia tropica]|uniref:Transglycosylase SLT domain-containing protein n=1 Tax=Pseudonocardia tropica TaxID=681289 RepID=A0ABV1JT68_9PSEU
MTILIGDGVIPIRAKDETAEGVAQAKRRLDNLRATAKLDADISAAEKKIRLAEAWLKKLATQKTSVQVDADTAKAMSDLKLARAELDYLDRKRTQMRVTADTNQARSGLRGVGQEAGNADNQVKRLNGSGRALGASFASAARGPAILMAIASAAGIAGAAVAAIPAALSSLGGIGGVLLGSLSGVGEALKGYEADQDAASAAGQRSANSAASSGRAIRDAGQAINDARRNQTQVARDSARQIEDAERSEARVVAETAKAISDAKADQARTARDGAEAVEAAADTVSDALDRERAAQEDLNDAFEEAAQRLQDLRDEQDDYALDVEGAAIRVAREEEQLRKVMADSTATDLDRREAVNQLGQARERLEDIQKRQGRSAAELAAAERNGLAGSEGVIAAQGRLTAAKEGTRDAEENLRRVTRDASEANEAAAQRVRDAVTEGEFAQQEASRATQRAREQAAEASEDAAMQVSRALQGLQDAQTQQAEGAATAALATSKYADAMAKLTPEGRAFVEQLIRMKPMVDDLGKTSQRSFLPGLTDMLRDSEGLFPIFNGFLDQTGDKMADSSRKAGQLFKNPEFKKDLTDLLNSSLPITEAIGDGMVKLTEKTVDFGAEMAPASEGFADFIDSTVDGWVGMYEEMEPYADDFKVLWQEVGEFLEIVLPLVGRIAGQVSEFLGPALGDLNDFLRENNDQLDDWVYWIGGAYLALKTLKTVGNLATWADGVATSIGRVGGGAKDADGKVSKLDGKLRGLKTIGKIGITFVAAYVGFELIQGLFDGGEGKKRLDTNQDGKVGTGERWESLKNFDFKGVGSTIWDDIKRNPLVPEGMDPNPLHMPEPPPELKKKWDDFWGGLRGSASKFATDNNLTWGQIRDNAGSRTTELRDRVNGVMGEARTWLGDRTREARDGISSGFGQARDWSGDRLRELRDRVNGGMGQARDWLGDRTREARDRISGGLGMARDWSGDRVRELRDRVNGGMGQARDWLGDRTREARDRINSGLGMARDWAGDRMRELKDRVVDFARKAKDGAGGFFSEMWRNLRDLGKGGVNGVIGTLNWLVDKSNSILGSLGVEYRIPRIQMLAQGGTLGPQMLAGGGRVGGGFVTNGPQAIVGEGRSAYPEFVIPTDPAYRSRALDLFASLGGQLMADGGQVGVPMLAEGGILGTIGSLWNGASRAIGSVGSRIGDMMNWFGGGSLSGLVSEAVGLMLPKNPWRSLGMGVGNKLIDGAKAKMDSLFASFAPGGDAGAFTGMAAGGVQRWAPVTLQALAMMGQPAGLLQTVLRRMNQESGGNPSIVNRWDSNWRKGTPSVGLMQVIGPTYRSNRDPRRDVGPYLYGTSIDPLSNILSSMRYALGRYGSLPRAYNKSGGYALGGRVPGTTFEDRIPILAQSGERVLTRAQNDAFERLVGILEGSTGLAGVHGEGDTIVNVTQLGGNPQETGRLVALGIRSVR